MNNLQKKSEIRRAKSFLIPNSSFLIKLAALVLIFTITAPEVFNAVNAFRFLNVFHVSAAFAKDDDKKDTSDPEGDLPLEKINRDHFFRMVELCWPKYIQVLIRKLANLVFDKTVQGILNLIPAVGGLIGDIWDSLKVFRDKVDAPVFPRCNCKDDDNTQDSAWMPLNWFFSQTYINKATEHRKKNLFPNMELNQRSMYASVDVSGYSSIGNNIVEGIDRYYDIRKAKYGPTLLLIHDQFNAAYVDYNNFTSVIDEHDRISDWWRKTEFGHLWIMEIMQSKPFSNSELSFRNDMLEKMFSLTPDDTSSSTSTTKIFDLLPDWDWNTIKEKHVTLNKTGISQTAGLQYLGVQTKLLSSQTEANAFTAYTLMEMGLTPRQNKRSLKNAFHKNVDLMAHDAANKRTTSRKQKLGF